ncbi:DUF192 domain-containing protein [Oceanicaulis sp. AH-315-P02]|nr:DUF192 domain-containing protein [Robiginitomaculum sp.]MBN4047758.1 DUF192 domain-containing protein [Oceanicaulis sp. AH-315-P02]
MKNLFLGILILLISAPLANAQEETVDFGPPQPLQIIRDGKTIQLLVDFADDPLERTQGLMFVKQMDDDRGMLFDFEQSRTVNMWMKDTLISLDMIFLDAKGKIVTIARNTKPNSLRRISSGVAVMAVLEVNAGLSRKWGIKRGDQVQHAMFDNLPITNNDDVLPTEVQTEISVEN